MAFGQLYPRVGFIITNLARPAERVVTFYNQRGTAEQWIKRARTRSNGRGCHAEPSPPTPSASSCTRSPAACGTHRG
jgi:hypothetical protein